MKKLILCGALGIVLSGCTVATVQTGVAYSSYPRYNTAYSNPYVYNQPRHYPRCYTTYQYNYYGAYPGRRVCY